MMFPRASGRAVGGAAAVRSVAFSSTAGRCRAARAAACAWAPRCSPALHVGRASAALVGCRIGAVAWSPTAALRAPGHRLFSSGTAEIKTPDFGAESITEGTVQEWQKKVGDFCAKGDILVLIETDKVSIEVKAEENGTLQEILAQPDETVEVGQKLAVMKLGGEPPAKAPTVAAAAPQPAALAPVAPATPAATAPAVKPAAPTAPTPTPVAAPPPTPAAADRSERRVKMTRMRQAIARRLKDAQNTAAMLTTFQEVDMGPLMDMRKEYKDLFQKTHGGVRLGFMSAFLKASAFALGQIPAVNAVIDDKTQEIIYRDFVDISVAVSSPKGLVVPVVRGVQGMSLFQIESAIAELAKKARDQTLTLDDSMGGTFTISNGGVFGSMLGTPIINPPQSAILGMHATKMRPVVTKSGEIKPRPVMYLALTYDHRLVDGREAVTFLCTVRDQIEDPRRLLLEL